MFILAFVAEGIALHDLAPDRQELVGDRIALVMRQECPIPGQLHRVAARDDVQQQAAI